MGTDMSLHRRLDEQTVLTLLHQYGLLSRHKPYKAQIGLRTD